MMMRNKIALMITWIGGIIFAQTTNVFPANGNVGIGTTSPQEKLHINGSIRGNAAGGALRIQSANGYIDVGAQNRGWAHIYTDRPKVIFNKDVYTTTNAFSSYNNSLLLKVGGTERMRINTNGNIGIGTTNPKQKLEVNGRIAANKFVIGRYGRSLSGNPDPYQLAFLGPGTNDLIVYGATGAATLNLRLLDGSLKMGPETAPNAQINNNGSAYFNGNIGIGTKTPDQKLTVKGKIHAEEVLVDLQVPADYVFERYYTGKSKLNKTYQLPSLKEVETYTRKHKHLPGVPSAKHLKKQGMEISKMTNLLLQKIEELTIYTLQQQKELKALQREIKQLKAKK